MNPIDSYIEAQRWAAIAPFVWAGSIIFGILILWALIVVIAAGHRYLNRTSGRTNAPQPQERATGRRAVGDQR